MWRLRIGPKIGFVHSQEVVEN